MHYYYDEKKGAWIMVGDSGGNNLSYGTEYKSSPSSNTSASFSSGKTNGKGMNQELENIYNSAKQAMADDLRLNYYNAAQERNFYFRQLNNKANKQHAMFSGMPAGQQMNYDKYTFLPNMASTISKSIQQQRENQAAWDKQIAYIKQINAQADYYNGLASNLNG
jgi:hypothetical protein